MGKARRLGYGEGSIYPEARRSSGGTVIEPAWV